jgi:hypothetical protein
MGNQEIKWNRGREVFRIRFFLVLFFMFSITGYSQLNLFDLEVVKTDETCIGNGTITFVTNNATPQASFLFTVYKLPNLSIPISVSFFEYSGQPYRRYL